MVSDDRERDEALAYLELAGRWATITREVNIAAMGAKRRFSEYVTFEDVEQVLWEWVMKSPKKIMRWHQEKDSDGFLHILGAVLYDEANYFGRKAKADLLGYKLGDEFYYTKGMLQKLLPSVYNRSEWSDPPKWAKTEGGGRSGKALNEGGGWMTTLADISRALSRLPKAEQRLLFERFALRREYEDLGGAASTSHGRVDAAVSRLLDVLGGPRWLSEDEDRETDDGTSWPVGRKAMSNAQARYVTEQEMSFEKKRSRKW